MGTRRVETTSVAATAPVTAWGRDTLRGVHVTAAAWGNQQLRDGILAMIDQHRIDTVQLDLKDDSGIVGFDTNVARVLFRAFVGRGDRDSHAPRGAGTHRAGPRRMEQHLWAVSRAVLPHRHVFDFNQALMDLGATVCTARNPKCAGCPMERRCKHRVRHAP